MNKWKISFFATLLLLILFSAFYLYNSLDKGKSSQQMREGYEAAEQDMIILTKILKSNLRTYSGISQLLKNEHLDFTSKEDDKIELNRIQLQFEKDSLVNIKKNW